MIFFTLVNLGVLLPMIFYNNIDYVLFNIIFFFFSIKILNMVENYIINKYFVKEDIISYENIQKKLNINNNLKFFNSKKNLINIHKRYFVLPILSSPAASGLRTLFKNKLSNISAGVGIGTVGYYGYDYYHKTQDRNISEENLKINSQNSDIAVEANKNVAQKAKEDNYIAKYNHLKEEKYQAEKLYADCQDSKSFFNNVKNKEAFAKKK